MNKTIKSSSKSKRRKQNKNGLSVVEGIKDLKNLLSEGYYEYLIALAGGGVFSRKSIYYHPKEKEFQITNWIDDSDQLLTQKQLMSKSYTNIGYALKRRALIVNLKEKI